MKKIYLAAPLVIYGLFIAISYLIGLKFYNEYEAEYDVLRQIILFVMPVLSIFIVMLIKTKTIRSGSDYIIILLLNGVMWGALWSDALSALGSGNLRSFLSTAWLTIPFFSIISILIGFLVEFVLDKYSSRK